jgi:hypothetical protein
VGRKFIAIALVFSVVIIGAIALSYHPQQSHVPISNVTRPQGGYLTIHNGTISQVYLINSSISYGTYPKDFSPYYWNYGEQYTVKKGDPCVFINGAIRNDGNKSWIVMVADLYNQKGEKVGNVAMESAKPWFATVHLESNNSDTFEIALNYDKQDVARYDIYLLWEPTAFAPP